jgi:hypothetical protein
LFNECGWVVKLYSTLILVSKKVVPLVIGHMLPVHAHKLFCVEVVIKFDRDSIFRLPGNPHWKSAIGTKDEEKDNGTENEYRHQAKRY